MFRRVTRDLVIRSRWRPVRLRPGERSLVLRSASVFPPSHPTTRLCLDFLAQVLAAFPVPLVLDVGCGSGILALTALALGAFRAVALDLSGQAVATTRHNAAQNGLLSRLEVVRGSTECLRGTFHLLVANLPWGVLLSKVEEFSRLAAPATTLILSGFKDTLEETLLAAYHGEGWSLQERRTQEEWVPELPPELSYTWVAWRLEMAS